MNDGRKPLSQYLIDWISFLGFNVRAAMASPILDEAALLEAKEHLDPDFERWVWGDPMVTRNPASRYGERSPGYISGNGLGSLEIGAADD
jgi:hypothetical protein